MKEYWYMDHKKISLEWFNYANADIEAARFLQTMRPQPLEIICYHCQQSAEKYLKGFIALNGGEIQKTHDLVSLNKICARYHLEFTKILEHCINLTDYGVQTRYPFQIEINGNDMQLALKSAEEIKKYVMQLSS